MVEITREEDINTVKCLHSKAEEKATEDCPRVVEKAGLEERETEERTYL